MNTDRYSLSNSILFKKVSKSKEPMQLIEYETKKLLPIICRNFLLECRSKIWCTNIQINAETVFIPIKRCE